MANEISITSGMQVQNGTSKRPSNQETKQYTQSAIGIGEQSYAVTTTEATITLPLTTPGWTQLRNDGDNPIQWGPISGGAMIPIGEMSPGAYAQLELLSSLTQIRVKTTASTSTLAIISARK